MKKFWIEYKNDRPSSPMTFWVHRQIGEKPWFESEEFDPPLQYPKPGFGYPLFFVEFDGFIFRFASLIELEVCIETLGQKLLPSTIKLSQERGSKKGPNSHWLSRLPAKTKSWKYRKNAVVYLNHVLNKFKEEFA